MKKHAIWVIVGLMTAAVVGVVGLQMDLIRTAIQVNEEKFEKSVANALNAVSRRLMDEERRQAMGRYINGFVTNYYQQEQIGQASDNLVHLEYSIFSGIRPGRALSIAGTSADHSLLADTCTCYSCLRDRDERIRDVMMAYQYRNTFQPLEQRISLEQLGEILHQELDNWNISTDFNYGVYSNQARNFVIVDDHYVVDNSGSNGAEYQHIKNSGYKVTLFSQDEMPPGFLMIYFPAKTSVVWSSVWPNLLGTLVFTAIIMLCFAYTVHVIFRQKKLSEMKTDFINNMTHEFKTPIATISLAADSITSPMISGHAEKVQRFANIIKQENKRMNSQVEKVLQMALIDKRDFSLKLTNVNLHDVIEHAVENISLQVEKKEGVVTAHLEATNPFVEGDLTHVSNIINNLLDNANKYSPDKPEISVHTRNVPNGVEVIISDKGIGMSKEARKHIFDKFYRVHTGNLHDVKGFGLGLSYVKAMMTAHKGQVDVKSEPGKGSSFILCFPYHVESKHGN